MAESKQKQHDRERLAQLRADTREVWHSPRVVKVSSNSRFAPNIPIRAMSEGSLGTI